MTNLDKLAEITYNLREMGKGGAGVLRFWNRLTLPRIDAILEAVGPYTEADERKALVLELLESIPD